MDRDGDTLPRPLGDQPLATLEVDGVPSADGPSEVSPPAEIEIINEVPQ
jgi:hypothetical protein